MQPPRPYGRRNNGEIGAEQYARHMVSAGDRFAVSDSGVVVVAKEQQLG